MPIPAAVKELDVWNVNEDTYPAQGSAEEKFRFLLQYAILAPSSHNTQPWLFKFADDRLELYADRTRALPVTDPEDRELIASCGCALFNLRLAMRYFGSLEQFVILPEGTKSDLLASVGLGSPYNATPEEHQLFRAIPKRHTNRMRFEDRQVPDPLLVDLQAAARLEGAALQVLRGETRRTALVDLIAEGDRIQMSSKNFRRELAAWVRANQSPARDGIPGYGFGFSDIISVGGPFFIRTFDLGGFTAARDRELADGSPVLAAICTEGDAVADWLAAGQALARVLLRARVDGVSASFLNQPVEVDELRPKLRDVLGTTGFPQLLLRFGYGPEVKATPRRTVDEVLASKE